MNQLFSVIIPCKNAESTIKACLTSVLSQTYSPIEIIVVDDGSSDNTISIVRQFPKVTLLINTGKHGPAAARNLGAKHAKGKILAFTDSDCVCPPKWVENASAEFTQNQKLGGVGGGYSSGSDSSFMQLFSWCELAMRRMHIQRSTTTLVSNNLFIRRDIFFEYKGFPVEYLACEDMVLSGKIAKNYPLIWLRDNGVIHHFRTSLVQYFKQQVFFGTQSALVLLQNRWLMNQGNHQGKILYIRIILSLMILGSMLLFFVIPRSFIFPLLGSFLVIFSLHFLSYADLLKMIASYQKKFVFKSYIVSLLRDILVGVGTPIGLIRFGIWQIK